MEDVGEKAPGTALAMQGQDLRGSVQGLEIGQTDLLEALKSKDARDRIAAVHALGKQGDLSVVKELIGMLSDRNHSVRFASADALGTLGDKQAIGPLLACCQDQNCFVRVAAREAIEKIREHQQP